jgi:hypothetical protein
VPGRFGGAHSSSARPACSTGAAPPPICPARPAPRNDIRPSSSQIRHAQRLLEAIGHPVDRIACGSGSVRRPPSGSAFKHIVGTSPYAYRAAFTARPVNA